MVADPTTAPVAAEATPDESPAAPSTAVPADSWAGGRRLHPAVRAWGPEGAVVAVALALHLWNLDVNGVGNTYYAAAVRSMSGSWHDFFYASVDPGGWITVDKPPLALWVQALSVRLFGYSTWSLLVPGALAGAAAVALLMLMVRRSWGRTAGLVAGVALATTPVAVAVARSNNPDGLLVLLVTAAAAALLRAVETGRWPWLLAAAALVAAGFLTKLLAALIVLPALWLTYLLFARASWRVRLLHLVAATGLLAVLCAGWVLAVDRTPLASRPWVGGSTDGTAADLVLGYNGIGRVTGAEQGPGGGFPGGGGGGGGADGFPGGGDLPDIDDLPDDILDQLPQGFPGSGDGAGFPGGGGFPGGSGPGGFPGGGIDQFGGRPGLTRLFNAGMGDQVMWLAPVAAAAAVAGLWAVRRRADAPGAATIVLLGGWAVTAFAVFSYAQGIFHNYYVSLLAPAVAGLTGIGASLARRAGPRGRAAAALVVVATAGLQLVLLRRVDAYTWLRPAVAIALLAVAAGLMWSAWDRPRAVTAVLATGAAAMLVAPAIWSFAGDRYAPSPTFPDARPATSATAAAADPFGAGTPAGPGAPGGGLDDAMLDWLRDQRTTERWLVAVGGVQQATAAIIDGDSVMPMGGFSGGDPAMTPDRLARLVHDGELRFVLTSSGLGGPGGFSNGTIDTIVTDTCTEVPGTTWTDTTSTATGTLYDCQHQSDAITRAAETN